MYDVIIIGAGSAGCTAAKVLAEKGYKTLLIEKFKMPRYKSCSGQLIEKTLHSVQSYFGETIPDSVMCTPYENRGMIFTNDKGREFRFEQNGLNVWRSSFDYWLAQKANEKGTEIREGTTVISCSENQNSVTVSLKEYTEQAKYVIDCEGVVSSVRRKITGTVPQYITTFQTFNEGKINLDYHYFYAYLQPELSEYDAWFNVKDNLLVLGVAVKDKSKIRLYYQNFIDYMKKTNQLQIEKQIKAEKWLMPHIRSGCDINYGKGRILFAGETAGFLNPMGEGISSAIESGYSAACAVSDYFGNTEMIHDNYKQRTRNLKVYMERQWNFVSGITNNFNEFKLKNN